MNRALRRNMKSYRPITLTAPLRDVCLVATASSREAEQRQRELEQAAYERGRLEGEKALSNQLLEQRAEISELQRGVLESLRNAIPQLLQETEKHLIDLALEAAQRLVAGMPIKPKLVEDIVREAIAQVDNDAEITVQLHPEDLGLLRKHESSVLSATSDARPLHFSSSAEITRGGCVIITRFGMLDARRETKVEQLRKSLQP